MRVSSSHLSLAKGRRLVGESSIVPRQRGGLGTG